MQLILAIIPLAIIFFLILVLKWSPLKAMVSALFALILIVIFFWQMQFNWILAASLKGFLFALEIGLIIAGALFFLSILKNSGFQEKIKNLIQNISQDKRVQLIIIAWAFTALIEGSAGFGTPVILATILLITLGFSTVSAITLSFIGNSLHVSFGAVGVPILFGFGAGLNSPQILNYLQFQGTSFVEFLKEISISIAVFNLFIGFLVCLIMLIILVFVFGKEETRKIKYVLEMIPFLIIASFLVLFPAWVLAYYLGPELPSLIGGLIGLFLLLSITQKRWFLPKTQWSFDKVEEIKTEPISFSFLKIFQILLPYFFLALIIFISRADFLPIEQWLINFSQISLNYIFGTYIDYSISPFYLLGTLLLLSGGMLSIFLKQSLEKIKSSIQEPLEKTKRAILILIIVLVFVQIFIYSGENLNNYPSMPLLLANTIANISGNFWPIFIPLVGALGSFITASATASNLLLSNFQANSALILGADPILFLSLQGIGAALGTMIILHNIIIVLTIVGEPSKANLIIKYNALVLTILCLIIGLFGFLIS